jgi:DinB family protein
MNAISLLRVQLEGSFKLIGESADETSVDEWNEQASVGQNPAGFTLWHCARSIDWAVNCAIQGLPEVADQPKWQGRLAPNAWFGYEVTLEMAREVAATVSRADVVEYVDDLQKNIISWLDNLSEHELDAVPDLESNYRSNGKYLRTPRLEAWIKEDAGTPAWQLLTGTCVGHIRYHVGEIQAQRQVLRSRITN